MDDADVVTLCGIMMIIRNIIFNRKHVQGFSRDIIFRIGKLREEKFTGRSDIIWCSRII